MTFPAKQARSRSWQAGAISRQQLLDAGLNPQLIIRRIERGRWQQLFRGVYAVFSGLPPRETWLWAAILSAGEGAVLSHQTAAELHGLLDSPADAIYVTVPSTRRVATRGLIIRTSGRVEQARQPNRAPPRTSVEETVLDLAQLAPGFDDACGWITKACAKRLTTEEKLRAALAMRKKMRWRAELDDVLAAAGSGIHSVLEYRYLRDVERAHGLPRSRHQVRAVIDGQGGLPGRVLRRVSGRRRAGRTAGPSGRGALARPAIGTPRPARKGCRRAATAGVTSTLTPARPRCCRRRSCAAGAGEGPRSRAQPGCPVGRAFSQAARTARQRSQRRERAPRTRSGRARRPAPPAAPGRGRSAWSSPG